jgi:hypothetical protein|tara:strand:+ start:707 stop:994 length:288 start_codon:yes stop_codon:yes gene_type:complete
MPLKKPNLGSPSSIKNIHNRKLASLNVLYYSKDTIGTVRTYKGTADGRLEEIIDLTSKADKLEGFELVAVSYLIHQSRMDIRNFNFHMNTALKNQ